METSNRPIKSHSDDAWRKADLREGFTTGACAAAAARAATRALLTGQSVDEITIDLPVRPGVMFAVVRCELTPDSATCGVIKDAGDDPDVTHGAEIQATVTCQDESGIVLAGGVGVGVVTKPGLPVAVGEAAINPVPRRMIIGAVSAEAAGVPDGRGLLVTISVPDGERLAQETLNPRLGIVGGISILGTTGIVKPFSASAYRASIYIELKMAFSNGVRRVVLTTGARSETYAAGRYPDLPDYAFVQVGDHMDYALKQARRLGFSQVVISGMIGKISKLAQGRMQTHVSQGGVDLDFLAEQAHKLGADAELVERIRAANTAHHVQGILRQAAVVGMEKRLAQLAVEQTVGFIEHAFSIEVLLFDIRGALLAVERME